MTMVLRRAARLNEAAVTPLDPVGLSLLVHRALFGDVAPGTTLPLVSASLLCEVEIVPCIRAGTCDCDEW